MLKIKDFLENSPRKHLTRLFHSMNNTKGLVQGSKVTQACYDWATDMDRLKRSTKTLSDQEKSLLTVICLSENRGISEMEARKITESTETPVINILSTFEDELLCYRRKGTVNSWHCFQENQNLLVHLLPIEEYREESSFACLDYQYYLSAHLLHFISRIQLGDIKITQKAELHRKSSSQLMNKLSNGNKLSSSLSSFEISWLYQFLVQTASVEEFKGWLQLNAKGKALPELSTNELWQQLYTWWRDTRLFGGDNFLAILSRFYQKEISIELLVQLTWFYSEHPGYLSLSDTGKKVMTGLCWEQLPVVLREAGLLGLIAFTIAKGKITHAKFNSQPMIHLQEINLPTEEQTPENPGLSKQEQPISLPNFESLLPPSASPLHRFQVELIAERKNDENLTRYKFTKESVIKGFQSGLTQEAYNTLIDWLGFDINSKTIFEEWSESFNSCTFSDVLLLHIDKPERLEELNTIPQFTMLIQELIPGYGFIVPRKNKEAVIAFLHQFGLYPGDSSLQYQRAKPVPINNEINNQFSHPIPRGKIIYFQSATPIPEPSKALKNRYTSSIAPPSLPEKVRIIKYAILVEKNVDMRFSETARPSVQIKPLHIIKESDNGKIIALDVETGFRNEYVLDKISHIKVME
ncbi:MAG: hypothetical protein HQK83_00605 [Fibrobacteria bacterium]|nr:hypothetical protein [Fibrobacteria bacterium]